MIWGRVTLLGKGDPDTGVLVSPPAPAPGIWAGAAPSEPAAPGAGPCELPGDSEPGLGASGVPGWRAGASGVFSCAGPVALVSVAPSFGCNGLDEAIFAGSGSLPQATAASRARAYPVRRACVFSWVIVASSIELQPPVCQRRSRSISASCAQIGSLSGRICHVRAA